MNQLHVTALFLLWLPLYLGQAALAEDRVPPKIQELMTSARYQQSHWGLLAVDLKTGEVRYELNADKLFAPASVTKCFSVATALDALGADYRFG